MSNLRAVHPSRQTVKGTRWLVRGSWINRRSRQSDAGFLVRRLEWQQTMSNNSTTGRSSREPRGMNIHGETMAEYYQRRCNERGADIERLKRVLCQALDCLNDETPEDCSREDARADTIQKIKEAINA